MLSLETMEKVIAGAMEFAEGSCSFVFQGGEPTLAGLDFYRSVVALTRKYAKKNVAVSYAIQTNAFRLDESWCSFSGNITSWLECLWTALLIFIT